MKYSSVLLAGSAASGAYALNLGAICDAIEDGGNWYCSNPVSQFLYSDLNFPGKYRAVASMDNSGTCTFKDRAYQGPLAPFDEDLSLHIRGRANILNVAVYKPTSSSSSKRDIPQTSHSKRHGHGHRHLHKKYHEEEEMKKRGDMVIATIDGQVQSWVNDYFGPSTTSTAAAGYATTSVVESSATTTASASKTTSASSEASSYPTGDFPRVAYYNAADKTAEGLVFLNHHGGENSGVWDTVWGNSLSYSSEDGTTGASSPTVFNGELADGDEIVIMSDKSCDDSDADCGVVRDGTVAYKGFDGATKVFVIEIKMPLTGATGFDMDMPAFWLLNAAIPRTTQYGDCSCWKGDYSSPNEGGCGELDVIEILTAGDTRAKSTFHFAKSLGNSAYIKRPTDDNLTVAVLFHEEKSTVSIKTLSDFDWPTSLTTDQVNDILAEESDSSLFSLMSFLS
ncbi:putative TOS1-like glycosyl hydrolase-domain-containing protein [Biscogniauxia mediterranea]|nr:putative TOS1-like glycosyl hydrolase-domain-containing protein [Biscogniauxia mediterranea]